MHRTNSILRRSITPPRRSRRSDLRPIGEVLGAYLAEMTVPSGHLPPRHEERQ